MYRSWGSYIVPYHTPNVAGLAWAAKLKTNVKFKGRAALEAQRQTGVKKLLATFPTDPGVILLGRETIFRNGERCGWLSAGGFGHTVGRSIGMGYVRATQVIDRDFVRSSRYQLEVAGDLVNAEVTLKPLYDPEMTRIKT